MAWNVRELRNLVERITILSANESKSNINKLIEDILNPSTANLTNNDLLEKSFTSPLKEARKHFEKEYLTIQLKKTTVTSQKQQILLEWKDLHFIENLKSLE